MSKTALSTWIKSSNACKFKGDYTNKSCRAITVSRMIASGVPLDVVQNVTGHKNPKSLARYNRT
jgi:intergrase/recombinase